MAQVDATRSPGLIAGVPVALGIGVLCAYTVPAVEWTDVKFAGEERKEHVTVSELGTLIALFSDKWWLVDLTKVAVAAAVSAVAFPRRQRALQACCISIVALAAQPLPTWLHDRLGENESLGAGLILVGAA
ncbi:MAG TPA: hypothetical protein VH475_12465 [Tepidisphaeraceae bacterium]|jgi:hypothetical protein